MVSTCSDLYGELENPVDPESTEYQGFDVYAPGDDISGKTFELISIFPELQETIIDTSPLIEWADMVGMMYQERFPTRFVMLQQNQDWVQQ